MNVTREIVLFINAELSDEVCHLYIQQANMYRTDKMEGEFTYLTFMMGMNI